MDARTLTLATLLLNPTLTLEEARREATARCRANVAHRPTAKARHTPKPPTRPARG